MNNPEAIKKATSKLYEEEDADVDYDSKALRRYQLQRLRYYYAVVSCDSIATAKNIYDNCDGSEFESTANIFDLRYVPEGMDFDEEESKDECTKIPANYKPNSTFITDALQHSKVKLTWDETPKERLTLSSRSFSQKEIDEMDFKAYLASDSESETEEKESSANKYASLLGGKFGSKKEAAPVKDTFGTEADLEEDDDETGDVDMEITFNPGLDVEKGAKEAEKEKEESTIAAYKRKEKERRKKRLDKFKQQKEDEEDEEEEKPSKGNKKNNNKNKNKKEVPEMDDKAKAELELVMMNENGENDDEDNHFSMKDVIRAEKNKNRKGKNKKTRRDEEAMVQENFVADLNDSRFNEVFENHDFAIDPTNSEFKKTDTMKKILNERSKRRGGPGGDKKKMNKKQKVDNSKGKGETASLVEKIKRKHNK